MTALRTILLAASLPILAACATAGTGDPVTPAPTTGTPGGTPSAAPWSVRTREHVDLWLHGYAMLQQDTARVPFFRRGYRDRMLTERRNRNVTSALDVQRGRLESRLASTPALVNGQFLPLYFATLDDLRRAIQLTLQAQGDPRATGDAQLAQSVAIVSASFPSAADRDWLRTFTDALMDEHRVFYRDWWAQQQAARGGARSAVEALWDRHGAAFRRYLSNTQQDRGEMLLSLPLNGEGRTTSVGNGYYVVAVNFPETASAAPEALYTFAHEIALATTGTAVRDHVTPAEQRSGVGATYESNAAVRGGQLLLARIAPELEQGYMRYYLASMGRTPPGGDPRSAFEAAFPLPAAIDTAIRGQLDVVLGGI